MIQAVRDWATGWLSYIFIILLCLCFGLWGISSYFGSHAGANRLATVNGEAISAQTYNQAYERARQLALQQAKTVNLTATQQQIIRQQVMQELIDSAVLTRAATQQGYFVPAGAVTAAIQSLEQFKVDGKFSPAVYERFLNSGWYRPEEFIEIMRAQQLTQQVAAGYNVTSFALDRESRLFSALKTQTRDISYVIVPPDNLSVTVAEDAVKAFYETHKNNYRTAEQVNLQYVVLSMGELMAQIKPTDEELAVYREQHAEKYTSSFDKDRQQIIDDYKTEQARAMLSKNLDVLTNLSFEQSSSLEPVARALNLSIKETEFFDRSGGQTDLTKNSLVIEAAFSDDVLNNHNNSQVINLANNTYVVLRVKEHQAESFKPLDQVSAEIKAQLAHDQASERARSLATAIQSALEKGQKLSEVTNASHLSLQTYAKTAADFSGIDTAIVRAAFAIDYDPSQSMPQIRVVPLSDGSSVVVMVTGVNWGDYPPSKAYRELAESMAAVEYAGYVNALINAADVKFVA